MCATIFQQAVTGRAASKEASPYDVPMDPYESGLAFGRFAALACCVLVVLAVIGGIVWAIVRFTGRRPPSGG
jgi:hypothetical protein